MSNKKKAYSRPSIKRVTIDNEISMVMMSPPTEPEVSIFKLNPLKWWR